MLFLSSKLFQDNSNNLESRFDLIFGYPPQDLSRVLREFTEKKKKDAISTRSGILELYTICYFLLLDIFINHIYIYLSFTEESISLSDIGMLTCACQVRLLSEP